MTPFNEYLEKSKVLRAEYKEKIEKNPAQKEELEKELKDILAKLIDEAEAKEIERSKHLQNWKYITLLYLYIDLL